MAITYDKKRLKQLHKQVNGGKKRYALKIAFFVSLFWYIFMIIIMGLVYSKTKENFKFDLEFLSFWFLGAVIMFVFNYYFYLKNWKDTKALYDDTITYYEEHDPSFLEDLE